IRYFGTRNNDDIEQHGEETFDQREHDPNSAISNIFSASCFDAILPEEPMKQSLTCTISHNPIIDDVAMNKPNSESRENILNIGDFVTGAEPEDQITVNYKYRRFAIKTGVQPDVRLQYLSDVFPLSGEQFGIPKSPHYLQDKNGEMHIIIQLPKYYLNRAPLWLRATLLTVCHNGQYYIHTNAILRDKKNEEIAPSNPVYFDVDKHDFLTDGIVLNLALITRKISELKAQQPLRPFNPPENFIHPCPTIIGHDKLRARFQLSKFCIAFTLCVSLGDGQLSENKRKNDPLTINIKEEEIEVLNETTIISDTMTVNRRPRGKQIGT
ncbi:unnamed protein product, partial [Didymodactylos carnosus]